MTTLNANDAAVLQTTLAAYDALFSELGQEARDAFEETVTTFMATDVRSPEGQAIEDIASDVDYTNWNYHLVNGLKSKIASAKFADEEENQAAQIASFVAQDLRIAGKLAGIANAKYQQDANNALYLNKINEVKALYSSDIDLISANLDVLNQQLDRINSDVEFFYPDKANNLAKEIASQTELLAEANRLKTQLDDFEAASLIPKEPGAEAPKGSGAEQFTKAYADFSQLRLDLMELKKVELLNELEIYTDTSTALQSEALADITRSQLDDLNRDTLQVKQKQDDQASFADKGADLKSSGISLAGNVLYAVQAGVGFALKDEDAPPASYVASSGYLGEAVLGGLSDILDITDHAKAANGFKGAASVALLAGNAASFAPIAQILHTGKDADGNPVSEDHLAVIRAEVGLQGTALALSAVETTLTIAQLAVSTGSKAASVLGSAIPIVGAIGSVVGAINPLKWAEFDQKQQHIDAVRDSGTYSSGLLGDLLSESKTIQEAFYGTTTALNAVTGVASGVIAATGVGAPIAAAVGLIGGAVSAIIGAFEQVALEDLANRYADKIRTDENGSEQSVEDFFEGSFEQKQEQAKDHYTDFFTDLVADDDIDQVVALGGQGLDATDLELSAITKTSGELGKTAQNFVETFTDSGWREENRTLSQNSGDSANLIQLQDAQGAKTYLTFTTPLFAAGNEELSRDSTGKNEYQTTLKITDLSGWRIRDYGDNETTFNMSKVVTSAQSANESQHKDIRFEIEAEGGNDTLFAYEAGVTFDGGAGIDTASYTRLSGTELASGVQITATGPETIEVHKNLSSGAKLYQESIHTSTTNYGKRTEVVEYRAVSLVERDEESQSTDYLQGVEILHGSSLNDSIDVFASTEITQVFGFGGDDVLKVGDNIEVVSGGAGNDSITVSDTALTRALNGGEGLYIDGGEGQLDALTLSSTLFQTVLSEYEDQQLRDELASEITDLLLSAETANRDQEFAATSQSLSNILRNNDAEALKQVALFNTEYVKIELTDSGQSSQNTAHSVTDYRAAVNLLFSNINTAANTNNEVDVYISAANNQTSVSLLGSDHNDLLEGSSYGDYLFGGDGSDIFRSSSGNDILVGGVGKDIYAYDASNQSGHDIITGPRFEDVRGDVLTLTAAAFEDTFLYRYGDDLVIGLGANRSVTVDNFYGYTSSTTLTRTNLDQTGLSSLQVGSDEFVVNVESPGSNSSSLNFYSSDNTYRSDFKSSYANFRDSGGFSMVESQQTAPADFANQLGLAADNERGGATLGYSESTALASLANTLGSSGGSASLTGGSGNLQGTDNFDVASYAQGAANSINADLRTNTVTHSAGTDSLTNIEGIVATGFNDVLIGNVENNYLSGGNGADTISGNGGNDIIHGGLGLDTLDGGAGFDIASYKGASYAIKFDLNGDQSEFYLAGGTYYAGDSVANFEGVIGTSLNDQLIGNADDNYLEGGNGIDHITGGAGNDIIHGGHGLDTLDGGEGYDIASYEGAQFAIKFDLTGNQSEFYLFNDTYYSGDSVANFEGVIGTSLNDQFIGNDEANYFRGGAGDDVFTGGAGGDTFVFNAEVGQDIITDYQVGTDKLLIEYASVDDLAFEQVGQDIRIAFSDQNSLTLQNVNYNQFVIEDSLFA